MRAEQPPVVFITGAAGGLGQALMREFAGHGYRVALGFHRTPVPVSELNELNELNGSTEVLLPVPLDVTNKQNVRTAVAEVLERWERIDVLVNNAGLTIDKLLARLDDDDWSRVLDVNLKGAFLCSQAVLRPMLQQRFGHIVNIGSFSGQVGAAGQANYASAKAGLIGLTQSLAQEVGSRNICVNAVLPGVLATPMTAALPAESMAAFAEANALGRINDAIEVARFVVFLTTMRNVSGQVFQLDSRIAGSW
jgi:3-oxoacyl-[acyl-carrier protein] reductase